MANVLNANELRKGVVFVQDGKTWKVIDYKHIKMGRMPATVKVKVQELEVGTITEKSFNTGETVEEADVEKRTVQFLYEDGSDVHFMDSSDYRQFSFSLESLNDIIGYLKEGQKVITLFLNNEPISIEIPKTVELEVTVAPEAVSGDSTSNPSKKITLETGLEINAPLFIKPGDIVKINTDTGEYSGRS